MQAPPEQFGSVGALNSGQNDRPDTLCRVDLDPQNENESDELPCSTAEARNCAHETSESGWTLLKKKRRLDKLDLGDQGCAVTVVHDIDPRVEQITIYV